MKLKTKILAAAAMIGLAATSVQATSYVNVSGVAGDVYTLDWNPGNALAVGSLPLSTGKAFTLYYQASLTNFVGLNGLPITNNSGLNSSYEITLIGGFGEIANMLTPTDAKFTLDNSNPINFVRMYVSQVNSSNLAGTGFNDGTLVMSGHISKATGSFGTDTETVGLLDQFGTDNWGGALTISGNGSTKATVQVDSYDTTFFTTLPDTFLIDLLFNTSNILPYNQVDPSRLFTDMGNNSFAPNIGTLNGVTGPDMLFQADANSSPIVTPEPSTMVLLGAGLFGLSVFARRRNNNK